MSLHFIMEGLEKYDFLTHIECDTIVNEILSLEDAVKRLGPDRYPATSEDSLTGRYGVFNYLNISSINTIICPKLKEIFGPCVVQCWANIFRQGEGIDEHLHVAERSVNVVINTSGKIYMDKIPNVGTYANFWATAFEMLAHQGKDIDEHIYIDGGYTGSVELTASGNIFLYGDPTTGTYYEGVKHDNKIGELSLFSPEMVHGVPQNTTDDMRISMAIDVHTGDEYLLNKLVSTNPERYFYIR
jgi:hypothetical protein